MKQLFFCSACIYLYPKFFFCLINNKIFFRPSHQNNWDNNRDRSNNRDWDTQPNHSNQRNDSYPSRNVSSNYAGNHNDSVSRGRDDNSKRFISNKRNRNVHENDDRRRTESPVCNRNFGGLRDRSREIRQVYKNLFI